MVGAAEVAFLKKEDRARGVAVETPCCGLMKTAALGTCQWKESENYEQRTAEPREWYRMSKHLAQARVRRREEWATLQRNWYLRAGSHAINLYFGALQVVYSFTTNLPIFSPLSTSSVALGCGGRVAGIPPGPVLLLLRGRVSGTSRGLSSDGSPRTRERFDSLYLRAGSCSTTLPGMYTV